MRNRFMLMVLVSFVTNMLFAQASDLLVHGVSPGLYLTHVVSPKENWYSVGRLYNISPKEIAPFNGVSIDKPLNIGDQLKIPLTKINFSQDGRKVEDEVFVPVYHIIQEKEWLIRISNQYKVPVEDLEKWNNMNKDQAKAGTRLIVGYMKVKKELSEFAAQGSASIKTRVPATRVPPVTSPPVVKTAERKKEPVVALENKPAQVPPVEEKKKEEPTVIIEEKKPVVNKPVSQPETRVANTNINGGYFRSLYEQSGKNASGLAGIFKSTSGWQDGKYYALMNNVPIGTVVAVNNPSNNKTVYAKVLGQLPDMKESVALTIRISDAAASGLEAGDARFTVNIKY